MNYQNEDAAMGAGAIALSDESSSPQVLVVDDTPAIRHFLALLLRASGYRVLEAEDGLAAKRIISTERPALVISDLEMPISDGWDVVSFCHKHCPETPVMIVSGALGKRPEIESWAAGSLMKPFSVQSLRAEVERLLPRAA